MTAANATEGRYFADGLIACHCCDGLHRIAPPPRGGKALCSRCGALMYRDSPDSLDRSAALYLSALCLFGLANAFPFIGLRVGDRVEQTHIVSGAIALWRQGMEIGRAHV